MACGAVLTLLQNIAGCTEAAAIIDDLTAGPASETVDAPHQPIVTLKRDVVRTWRVQLDDTRYCDGTCQSSPNSDNLTINIDRTWTFGVHTGRWVVVPIDPGDWTLWSCPPGENTRKLVLTCCDGSLIEGPIEDTDLGVESFRLFVPVAEPKQGIRELDFVRPEA